MTEANQLKAAREALNAGRYSEAERMASDLIAETAPHEEYHSAALVILAGSSRKLGNIEKAIRQAEQALVLADEHCLAGVKASAWSMLGAIHSSLGSYDKALEFYGRAVSLSTELGNTTDVSGYMGNIGTIYKNRGDYEQALLYYGRALATHEELGNKSGIAGMTMGIGNVHVHLGDYEQAIEFFGRSFAMYEVLGNASGCASASLGIGNVYFCLGNYEQALEYMERALAAHKEHGEKSNVALVLGNIGTVHVELGNCEQALEYYGYALTLYEELYEKSGIARITMGIGNVYDDLGVYEQALEYYGRALAIHEELGEKSGVALVTGNIGTVYSTLGKYKEATESYRRSLALYEQLGGKTGIARALGNMGNLHANHDFDEYDAERAKELFLRAIKICMEIGAKKDQYELHKSLAALFEKDEQWEKFAIHFKQYHELEKAVQSEEATQQAQLMEHRRKIEESERDRRVKIARFQEQEKILHNILPSQIADRMIDGEKTIADRHENVSVFFSDIVGFTKLSQRVSAEELVGMLNGIFTQFDQLARKHGLEKIKTIGDAYMAVCGAPIHVDNHAERTALFALDVAELTNNYQTDAGDKIMIRIGLHSGSVVAGIIGENKFAYDLWGDAVNTASRMESHGEAGKIHVSEEFKNALVETHGYASLQMTFIERGEMEIKGKGKMKTYFMEKA